MKQVLFLTLIFLHSFLTSHSVVAESKAGWPSPVMDEETFGLAIFDLLEYQSTGNNGSLNWDFISWRGGDVHRLWVKSEGAYGLSSPRSGDADLQVLYGKLVTSYYDAQIGARLEQTLGDGQRSSRASAVLGLQGLAIYIFEFESALFIGSGGHVAGRIAASKDFRFTQKAIVQARIETNAAAKKSDEFEMGSGINDLELGLRLRYEFKREIAPYIGLTSSSLYGETAEYKKLSGGKSFELNAVCGIRLWF